MDAQIGLCIQARRSVMITNTLRVEGQGWDRVLELTFAVKSQNKPYRESQ